MVYMLSRPVEDCPNRTLLNPLDTGGPWVSSVQMLLVGSEADKDQERTGLHVIFPSIMF